MFYIERSVQGPPLCSDIHDCYGMTEDGELGWIRDGLRAIGFETKIEAEDFAMSHGFNPWVPASEFDPRYLIVEELRVPEIGDIVKKYNARLTPNMFGGGPAISWGNEKYCIKVVTNTDVDSSPSRNRAEYVYVVGARLMDTENNTVVDEVFNPTYKQMEEFVNKYVTEHGV